MIVNTTLVPVIVNNNNGPKRVSNDKTTNKKGRVSNASNKEANVTEVTVSPFVEDKEGFLKYAKDRVEIAHSENKHVALDAYEGVQNFDKREELQNRFAISIFI